MKLKAGHKFSLCLFLLIMAAALCALPFFIVSKQTVYVYTKSPNPDSQERGFIAELKRQGFSVKENAASLPPQKAIGFWFKNPTAVTEIAAAKSQYNFLYSEEYYPAPWENITDMPVLLTPYRSLYEHYVRSNLKTALFNLGVNPADFYPALNQKKEYPVLYYGDNNKPSPPPELFWANTKILGNFWENANAVLPASSAQEKRKALQKAAIVVIYNEEQTAGAKKIPAELMEATSAGALVISSKNPAVAEIYGDSVVICNEDNDLNALIAHYLANPEITFIKSVKAQNITAEKLSSAASVKRFIELLNWLEKNALNERSPAQ